MSTETYLCQLFCISLPTVYFNFFYCFSKGELLAVIGAVGSGKVGEPLYQNGQNFLLSKLHDSMVSESVIAEGEVNIVA